MIPAKRIYIISNRLPVSFSKENGKMVMRASSGGLISAMNSYLEYALEKGNDEYAEKIWVGVPGCSQSVWAEVNAMDTEMYQYLPVFINHNTYDGFYNGMSNSVIWPLFHYFPSYAEYNLQYFENYIQANSEFLDVLIPQIRPNDVIWIHDYHLMPLAGMIRKHFPNITIGFFLHIPFPSYELFRMMPDDWQKQILEGLLGADMIGFHTIDYAIYFLKSVQRVLNISSERNIIRYNNRLLKVDVFPISIGYQKYNSAFNLKEVTEIRENLHTQYKGKKIIFSVDRLDYTKGVLNRLKGYERFFKMFPGYIEKVVFILSIVPSRDSIIHYAKRKKEIDEFIGNFNSRIGSITWKPINYQYRHLDFIELSALYTASDVAMITPLRDGMNLVSKEFVASRLDQQGVLLLSEMAGAARELTDALLVNPNDTEGMAKCIWAALEMDSEEQRRRLSIMQHRIQQYDVNAWAEDFLTQLAWIKKKQTEFEFLFLGTYERNELIEKYRESKNRLILLDYDGTLVPFSPQPEQAVPDENLLHVLATLAKDNHNHIFIVSGRDSKTLEKWLGHLEVNLIAEHGAIHRFIGHEWEVENIVKREDDWKSLIHTIMQAYAKRCANTFVEVKDFSVVWHYRNADTEQARLRVSELFSELSELSSQLNVQVLSGNKIIEVRVNGMDKGYITRNLIKHKEYDFILCCGDDNTDEDMFKVLANYDNAVTIKIGDTASFAKYNLYTPQMTVSLLDLLTNAVHVGPIAGKPL